MAPRKKPSSKKSNQSVQQSQPSKFGIQHFFERHTQANSQNPNLNPNPNPNLNPNPNPNPNPTKIEEESSSISPEITKSMPLKRFKFSPGLLIKQSQDEGGDEITWKVSPVNERLKALTSKQLLRPYASALYPCSQNQGYSSSVGKLEKWLSSPTTTTLDKSLTSSRSFSFADTGVGRGRASNDGCKYLDMDIKSAFQTPPSLSCGPNQLSSSVSGNGVQYRKQLLELLDQVEDAITEDSGPATLSSSEDHASTDVKIGTQNKPIQGNAIDSSKKADRDLKNDSFLVLEVCEKHTNAESKSTQNPFKVLRLFNERSGQEHVLHLCDEWFYSLIGPGDTINVIGEFDDQGKCVIDHDNNLLIIHPDILVSGTRVASSFSCPRRAVLDERIKSTEQSTAALVGTLLHQIFQAGLVKDSPTRHFLEEYAGTVLHKNIENLYACGANESYVYSTLIGAIPKILNWTQYFRAAEEPKGVTIDFGQFVGQKSVQISEVIDIEEMACAPRYGLKGMIDASLRVIMSSSCSDSYEKIMPLEFKTGKATSGQSAMEHCAQVILYTLLMSDRYLEKDVNSGLLYYLHTDQTLGISVQRSDMIGLVMRRNELATDILKASSMQNLPPMLQNLTMCKGCRQLNICTVYHKAYGGNKESSGLGDLFDKHVNNLTVAHNKFLRHWDRLIDLEAKVSQVSRREILHPQRMRGEHGTNCLSSIILDVSNGFSADKPAEDGRFIYQFVRRNSHHYNSEMHSGENMDASTPLTSNADCTLRCGDRVILSTESGRIAVANGIICGINHLNVSISFSRCLRLPGSDFSSERSNLIQEIWRIDKDEVASSFATMRFNLIQLFGQSSESLRFRKMIVDLESPRFDSGGIFSQDPALSYVRSENSLNDDQRRAIHKILTAKDYTLILGMPGTGKTSTMVHAVKALLMRGASILLTSYTNSAVDNLLIKLKAQDIDFIRIGRHEVVHDDIRDHCFSGEKIGSVSDIKQRMEHVRVVGVTCLGIHHPLLANKKFDICIMDEAGQITLPVSLGPLMLASTFVLVGDHYQLPPLVQSVEAREKGMSVSLFCRLSEAHPQAISALQCQYRMCSAIMELSNALIYGNRLRCGSSEIANAKLLFSTQEPISIWLKEVLHPSKPVIFINTDQLPAREVQENKTVNNPTEAYIVSEITGELVKRDIPGDEIGIITPYNSQVNLIRRQIDGSMEIHTIDKYQGRDKDCILVSFVRSNENSKACTSSLLGDWHRINVALTRAKKKLIMVGSCGTLSKIPILKLLIEKVEEQSGIFCISNKDIQPLKELKKCSQTFVK